MKVIVGADHRGQALKQTVLTILQAKHIPYEDISPHPLPDDDYVDFAEGVGRSIVASDENKGILLCGSGIGMVIAANKMAGVRAGMGESVEQVKAGRADDDMNVLVLAADFQSEGEMESLLDAFLTTPFVDNDRHVRRLDKINLLEEKESV